MCDRFAEHPNFQRTAATWLPESPFPAQTEREQVTLEKGLPVYRAVFVRH
jgi:tRNA (guanine-N7-)-methyltransferase